MSTRPQATGPGRDRRLATGLLGALTAAAWGMITLSLGQYTFPGGWVLNFLITMVFLALILWRSSVLKRLPDATPGAMTPLTWVVLGIVLGAYVVLGFAWIWSDPPRFPRPAWAPPLAAAAMVLPVALTALRTSRARGTDPRR